jgi:hypothetical protein
MNREKIIDAARHLGASKFWVWAVEEELGAVIENFEDVFNLSRDPAIIVIGKLRLSFEDGTLKSYE